MKAGWYELDPWWTMCDEMEEARAQRRKELERESREVRDEMIRQDAAAGVHPHTIAKNYRLHICTVYDIIAGRKG